MKIKTLAVAASLTAGAGLSQAQSSVTLFGLVDLSVRVSDHQGASGDGKLTSMLSGGLAPSRWGIRISEDLGGGLKAIALLDSRFQADAGTFDGGLAFQQSWVGFDSPQYGRITFGRDYNILFDLSASTFAAFLPIGPFLNNYKPEVALALGSRNDNQIKYRYTSGALTTTLQVSASEDLPFTSTTGKSRGGTLRYVWGPLALGTGYLERVDSNERKARAFVVGAAYRSGPWYLNTAWAQNRFDDGLNSALLLVGSGAENTVSVATPGQLTTRVRQRDLLTAGLTFDVTSTIAVGGQYWRLNQSFHTPGALDGKGHFAAFLANYRLSKRTDLYSAIERTTLTDLQLTDTPTGRPNSATKRTALMLGIRHLF